VDSAQLASNNGGSTMKSTEIIFIIDKSGSMAHLVSDTIGGFNGFIASQKALDGKATLTTVLFDTRWKMLHDGVDIHEVKPMTSSDYMAGGGTAMLDAIGETINRVQDRHDELGSEKPENVLFVITTDGEENSSRNFTKAQIEKMIKHQTNGHGWEFMFLGANMDSVKEAASIGINSNRSVTYDYTSKGVDALYATMDCMASSIRCNSALVGEEGEELILSNVYAACSDADKCTNKAAIIID
jgi:uncharacterized protein YegL